MTPPTLGNSDTEALRLIVEAECLDPSRDLPCATVSLVGDGRRYATGLWHYGISPRALDENQNARSGDDVYWLASCTKLVTAIACLQLVEKHILGLDDADCVSRHCPELEEVKVLEPSGQLVDKMRRITLRMLLTHTGMYFQQAPFLALVYTDGFSCSWVWILLSESSSEEIPTSVESSRIRRVLGQNR